MACCRPGKLWFLLGICKRRGARAKQLQNKQLDGHGEDFRADDNRLQPHARWLRWWISRCNFPGLDDPRWHLLYPRLKLSLHSLKKYLLIPLFAQNKHQANVNDLVEVYLGCKLLVDHQRLGK